MQNNKKEERFAEKSTPRGPRGGGPGRGIAVGKPKDFKESLRKLLAYLKPYLPMMIFALVLAMIGTVFSIIGPDKIREITDYITKGIVTGIDLEAVSKIGVFLATIYILGALFNYIQGFIMATVTQRISKSLRRKISEKINRLPLKYFDSNSIGDILSRVTNDVDTIGNTLNQSLGTIVSSTTLLFGSLFMMLMLNIPLTLSAVASTLIGFRLITIIIKRSQKYFLAQQVDLGRLNGHIEESYTGHVVLKAYNGEEEAIEEFKQINEKLFESAWKSQFMSGLMMPVMAFIGNLGYVVVSLFGSALAIRGTISFGVVVAFMLYVRLFTQPLSRLAQAATRIQSALAASERVFEFLEEKELENENSKTTLINLDEVKGDVSFRNIHFGYEVDKKIIENFNFDVKAGEKIAIVGPTGAGKTTMVNLLMRFYEVDKGEILVDGVPINDIRRENVHDLFSMVLQDTWLFEGTIKENIIYSKQNVTDAEVEKASKAAGVHHFIQTLPEGYDTVLRDAANISSGQRQLLTIARAMIENAPLLILDEATSSVDTRTEVLIQEAMDKLMVGKTSFVIAHRLSTIKNADAIIVMDEGKIVESGTHNELLDKNGFYSELYNSQFEKVS
jgi:ATP-binding cassette subfamily B protein